MGAILILFFIFIFYFIPSQDHEIRQHDEFDGNFTSRHLIVNSGNFFETSPTKVVYGSMNGLPRANFVRFTEPVALLMYFFGSLTGYAIAFILMRLIAFLGIYLLGRDFLKFDKENKGVLLLISLCFACLPYNTSYFLSIAGVPLAFWAFLNIKDNRRIKTSFVTLIAFAVSSNFVLVGFHICFVLGLLAITHSVMQKKINWFLFIAVSVTALTYVLTEYMMFYMHLFNSNYHTSRQVFEKELSLNIKGVIGITFTNFFTGEFNAANYFGYILIPFIIYFIFIMLKDKPNAINKTGLTFLIIAFMCSFLAVLFDWNKMSFFYETFSFARIFNLKRFISLVPGLFFIVVLFSFFAINVNRNKIIKTLSMLCLLVLFGLIWRGNISRNRSSFDCKGITINGDDPNTFRQFFNVEMYKQIKKDIGKDSLNNVISFGLLPSACKYVGLNVLDDYQGDYPLEYKQQFRKIIAGEIEKSATLKDLFDGWGSKCYMFSANGIENKLAVKNGMAFESDLQINTDQLKKMNCNYILSSILIGNAGELNLKFKKAYVSSVNEQRILLYKII